MTTEKAASRTVGDIVRELQQEQKKFNFIIRVLVGLLAVTAVVMLTLLTTTFASFNSARDRFDQQIQKAAAAARVADAYAKYDLSSLTTKLDSIQVDQDSQRDDLQLLQNLNRALSARSRSPDLTLGQLTDRAKSAARGHALGRSLNTTTAILLYNMVETPEIDLSAEQKRFLQAIYGDWQKPGETAEDLAQLAASAASEEVRGLAHAALALQQFANVRSTIDPGSDPRCNTVIDHAEQAARYGISGLGPYAWAAECMRKQGRSAEALKTFTLALAYLTDKDATDADRSLAARGAGTTLISEAAAGRLQNTSAEPAIAALREALRAKPELAPSPTEGTMAAARKLIDYAATMGASARSGVLEVYTRENVGFTYIIDEDWQEGYDHAQGLNQTVSSPWNLIVLTICGQHLLDGPQQDLQNREEIVQAVEAAKVTLSEFAYDWFNANDLGTLHQPKYAATIKSLMAEPEAREARKASRPALASTDG